MGISLSRYRWQSLHSMVLFLDVFMLILWPYYMACRFPNQELNLHLLQWAWSLTTGLPRSPWLFLSENFCFEIKDFFNWPSSFAVQLARMKWEKVINRGLVIIPQIKALKDLPQFKLCLMFCVIPSLLYYTGHDSSVTN